MKKSIYFLSLFMILGIHSLSAQSNDEKSIQNVLDLQVEAWNNGDIDSFMKGYWKSEELCFIGASGVSYGWNQVLENYKKGYPDKEAMGKLSFDILEKRALSSDHYMVLGKFQLDRKFDMPNGSFSLIWRKIDGNWKIISDHTSASVKGN